ncbi:MAG: ureidoglycolate lyase [Caulobacterales bacterium]|nr:ureidoglycolate lyase [Caulobacterales bacterium]
MTTTKAERVLVPAPLTAEAFRPFGDVIAAAAAETAIPINAGHCTRFHDLAGVDAAADGGRAGISIFRATPLAAPIAIAVMERHPLGSQAFIPLQKRPFLVVVAPPGELDPDAVRAFRAAPGQGVNYARGVWHHFLLALEEVSDFLVVDRIGPGENLEERDLPPDQRWTIR